MTHMIRQGCLSLFVFMALPVLANQEAAETTMDVAEETGADLELGSSLLAMGTSLLIVVALILVMAWLAKKFNIPQSAATGKGPIKMLAITQLSGQVKVCILEVGKVQLLVSMSGQNARTLHVFDEPVIATDTAEVSEKTLKDMFRKKRQ